MLFIPRLLALSIGVTLRMIVPLFVILFASGFFWLVVGIFTLGLSSHISIGVTMVFISLYGTRIALELSGERSFPDIKMMIYYAFFYGTILQVTLFVTLFGSAVLSAFMVETFPQIAIFRDASATPQNPSELASDLNTFSIFVLLAVFSYAVVHTALAVPMAGAAQSTGHRSQTNRLFSGFGSSFLALLPIIVLSIFVQVFFKIYAFIIVFFGLLLLKLTIAMNLIAAFFGSDERLTWELFETQDISIFLKGLLALFVVVWLQSLIWSASALALKKHQKKATRLKAETRQQNAPAPADLRALRKSRQNHTV